ncbi:MAG: putative polymerase, sigma-24 subunit, subfamily [Nocardioidaceae bacterium]|nr:putative polymerase, sigma-24 subunit, subfamily [Nocardioidaceae bacterium]
MIALLAGQFGDLDLADEAVQDGLVKATQAWPERGIPDNPAAWLLTVARNAAIDRLRRTESAYRRTMAAAPELVAPIEEDEEGTVLIRDDGHVGDEHLRLMLLCCHPALDRDAQVALTLRLVGGLTTAEIASAFLIPDATLGQRIVRAKRKIRDARIPLSIPAQLDERIDALLGVLYLIFNEGYLSHETEAVVRIDLADQAVRLTSLAHDLLPGNAEVEGLLALELFHRARFATRADEAGDLVLLEDQDRTQWDLGLIETANTVLSSALVRMRPGPYQLQAIIAGQHANARTAAETDWTAIERAYRQLAQMTDSPVVALNHAVAVAMADGPNAGLALLDSLDGLERYHLFHATRGELLLRAGRPADARAALERARALTSNPAEQRHLDRRIAK